MEIKELQEIYASHPGVTALRQLDESDYKSIVKVNGLTASSAAVAIAGYMHKEEKQTLFIIMNDAEEQAISTTTLCKYAATSVCSFSPRRSSVR